ncbi:E3 ubiquitin-protein ligase HUWE1 [Marchantia polymorpha subsp. ruderalis]
MKAKKKRGVEAPLRVRTFINTVINTPLENIEAPLTRFSWDYEKGDFYHWVDLLNHFESFFEKYVKPRKDLQLDGNFLEEENQFPKEAVLQILRVTRIVLENCMNKFLYNSNEHVSALFASTDPEIVIAALETLAAFVKKPVQSNRAMRWHGDAALNARLFSLSQGWGGKEEGLGLLACAIENGCDVDAYRLGSTLHFEFYADGNTQGEDDVKPPSKASGLQVVHISDLHLRPENDLELLKKLTDQHKVPPSLRFSLLTRIRFARAFASLTSRRQYICIRLLAFTVLLQSNPDHEDLTAFFINEPEFVNELVTVLRCEDTVPEDIRILAVLALAAQSQDRPRQSSVLTVISAGGHRGILPSLMQKAVGSVTGGTGGCSVAFVEALLSLVTVLVSSSSGCAALREAGLIPTLLPLLKDMNPQHTHLVSSAVHILEAFMDYSNPAGTLFRDLGGLDDTIVRLKLEVSRVEEGATKQKEELQVDTKGKAPMIEDGDSQQTALVQSETLIPYHQRLLLKALLRAIALGTYAPGSTARLHGSEESALPACLCTIFRHAKEFGGGVFSLAASVMSDLIHKDPTCFSSLDAAGLPAAFLDAITSGVLPSSEAVGCIPNSLDALCLNNLGLQAVKDRNALGCFVKIFTSKMYLRALANDTPGSLASGVDELMRHAPSLRGPGIDMCIEILTTIATIGGATEVSTPPTSQEAPSADAPVPMDTDSEERPAASPIADVDVARPGTSQQVVEPAVEGANANVEAFLPECINNVVRLLETILQNADTSRVFIEKKGIEALLQLYTLPHLPVSFGGSSTAHNMSVTFRAFSPQHASALTRAVCCALKDHLKVTVELLDSVAGAKLSELETGLRNKVVRCLSAAECFISLTSVLVRSSIAMMPELSGGGSEVLNDVGKVHREVLWQIALIDDAKVDLKKESETGGSTPGSTTVSTGTREGEDDTDVYSVIRYVNPVPSRNGPASHWGVESDFLPVLHNGGDGPHRRRREHAVTTEAITQMARLGRLSRHNTDPVQVDLESAGSLSETPQAPENTKRKSPDAANYEMMTRLVGAARGLYVALGKAMVIPSRRREQEHVSISGPAKSAASALAKLLRDELSYDGHGTTSQLEPPVSVKCRYLGKVVEDIIAVVFDSRRRTCNTVLVNNLFAHGGIKQLLVTFEATSQLLWRVPQASGSPMDTENGKPESSDKVEDKSDSNSWLLDTLRNYARLLEHLVTSSFLLFPTSMAQHLVQPVEGGTETVPKDSEAFIRALQAQVLEVVLPVWNHPMFPQCSANFITSIAAIITHVYTGVGDVKGHRNGSAAPGARLVGPPPDESSISRIVEMGFSRSRAEEALRRVENSVEMATEWLCSLPEGAAQEDDELARALALSLGSADGTPKEEAPRKGKEAVVEEEGPQALPVEDMLSTCMNLLQNTDAVAFPLTDLLVTMCNRNKGQDRPRVISYLIQQLKQCKVEESQSDGSALSTISHTLALVLSEDTTAREIAAEIGLSKIALEILASFKVLAPSKDAAGVQVEVPKWATALLLVLYHMLQYKPKINSDAPTPTAGTAATSNSAVAGSAAAPEASKPDVEVVQKEKEENPFIAILGKPTGYMSEEEQKKAMSVCCNLLQMQLPAMAIQAVLQLCARLTKTHPVAMQFLEAGGLIALLGLPKGCLFTGFDSVAAAIIRHLLEDPQTLQQAMESEIRHTLIATLSRHNGRVSPRMFLTAMAPVVSRDPSIFMQAVAGVCQIETVAGRPNIVLAKEKEKDKKEEKDREKEKEKDKEKDKEKEKEKEKEKDKDKDKEKEKGKALQAEGVVSPVDGGPKAHDGSVKSVKGHKKVPHSFSQVMDQLLEVILHYPPPGKEDEVIAPKDGSTTAMDVDDLAPKDKGKAKVDEVVKPEGDNISESSAALAKVAFILKLTTEVLLMYSSAVSVVLRRDSESSQGRGPAQGGLEVIGHGGLLYHVLHRLLPYPGDKSSEKMNDDEWREKLSDRAGCFLMSVCVRSGEGRRRVVVEIARALTAAANSADVGVLKGLQPPNRKVRVFVDLVNYFLSHHSSSGTTQTPGFSADMAKTMMDAGMVQALTLTLQVIDLDHPDAPKLVNAVLKGMEILTRAGSNEAAFGSDASNQKKSTAEARASARALASGGNGHPASDTRQGDAPSQTRDETMRDLVQAEAQQLELSLHPSTGADTSREDLMEDDLRLDRELAEEAEAQLEADVEEELMREAAEDAAELEDAAAEMAYRMEHGPDDDVGDEDDDEEDMDGDDGDDDGDEDEEEEEEDEEEDEDDIEGDEGVPHLSPPDTDVEDHEDNGLGDEYEDDMVEEEDEDDDWREDRVIEVRWRDGLTGLNHVQVLGHTGTANLVDFSGDPFHGMNMDDVFGNFRRPGGGDRRRATAYRAFPERPGGDRGGAFHHPLLTRPSPTPGVGSTGPVMTGSLWPTTGSFVRDAEALMGGGSGLDVTHFYMYDTPILPDHAVDGLFGERGVVAPPPPLLDFSMDPVYLMGRRGGRADSRLSSWTDDGQPQAGAHAAAVAQAIEEQFISQLRLLVPGEDQPAGPAGNVTAPESTEAADARLPDAAEDMEGAEPEGPHPVTESSMTEQRDTPRVGEPEPAAGEGGTVTTSAGVHGSSIVEAELARSGEPVAASGTDLDVQMQDERNEPANRDVEAGSQDSGESGATVGESLRSLEVEIGSADGRDPDERQAGPDRLSTGEIQRTAVVEVVPGQVGTTGRAERGDADEEMDGSSRAGRPGDEAETADRSGLGATQEELAGPVPASAGAGNRGEEEGARRGEGNAGVNAIDPTFLEALPEDLRAEVLASQQTQTIRATSHPPPPAEDIDPEFLAALPPDIQAEVLAQQRAQRVVQAQQVEGQPVDMDSASIIATFPAELREEVLLTSSESVLAALPPALIAEAQLLRERALSQYQSRGLFGGHRIGRGRNNMGVGTGGGATAIDRGVGGATGLPIGRSRNTMPLSAVGRVKEAEGKPLVDTAALKAMLRLLRLAQPLGKGLLQRLLLNLCAHSVTRITLLQLLLDMLRPEAEGISAGASSADGAPSQRLYGCQWNVVYARSQLSDGVPPLVSRRVLEILTYLARSHSLVANLLLYLEPLSLSPSSTSESSAAKVHDAKKEKGKAKVVDGPAVHEEPEPKPKGEIPLILLLKLLNQPLYSRSSAHLEQVMGLLEVVTTNAGAKAELRARTKATDAGNTTAPVSGESTSTQGATTAPAGQAAAAVRDGEEGTEAVGRSRAEPTTVPSELKVDTTRPDADGVEPSTSGLDHQMDPTTVLLSLPEPELRNLCKLLAREGLSDTAYSRVAEVLKKLAIAAPPHRRLFVTELADAARRLGSPAINELTNLGDADTAVVSTTSMAGAAILRVLQALSALTSLGSSEKENDQDMVEKEQEDGMSVIRDLNSALEGLWHGLSISVGKIEGRLGNSSALSTPSSSAAAAVVGAVGVPPPLPPGTQKLLPFVEAFFVLCEKMRSGPAIAGLSEPASATAREVKEAASSSASELAIVTTPRSPPPTPQRKPDDKGMTFIRFADKHRRLLNAFVRQNPGLLEKSLCLMLKTPRLIDFDNKRAYFRSRIRQQHEQQHYTPLRICVRRAYVLEDSYNQLRMRTPEELKGRLTVQFQGEEGIDAGGLTREWYQLLSRVTFDKGALLFTTVGNESTFQPNPNSVYQTEHLSYFKFVGRVVAKALFDGQLLDVYFTRSFYKHILDVKVTYHDIEAIDPDYYKNLKWMLENDISDILGLTFSMDADEEKHILYEKTEVTDYELIAGGRNIRVTEENKHEYVDLVAEHRLTTAIRPQIIHFLEGFQELVSSDLISIFNDKELELLISGLPEIDLEDLKANTEYTGYTAASPVVQWFWEVVRAFNKEDMARLLQFITGTSKVPLEGFRALQGISGPQRFQIHKAYGAPERLPSAHTCFNQLDLPEYASKEQLQERLLLAIHEGSEGFGFG